MTTQKKAHSKTGVGMLRRPFTLPLHYILLGTAEFDAHLFIAIWHSLTDMKSQGLTGVVIGVIAAAGFVQAQIDLSSLPACGVFPSPSPALPHNCPRKL